MVAGMETEGMSARIGAEEATGSLAAVKDSRRRAKRADYPVWYWLGTGAAVVTLVVFILVPLAEPWRTVLTGATLALSALTGLAFYRVRRMRGARAHASAWWEMWSLVPVIALLVAAGLFHRFGPWQDPLAGLATAGVAFVVYVVTGLAISSRPTRPR